MAPAQDFFWNPEPLGYGFAWDGEWYYWEAPEVHPLIHVALIAIGGSLVLYGLAPNFLRNRRRPTTSWNHGEPARFEAGLLAGAALLSIAMLLRRSIDFHGVSIWWLGHALMLSFARSTTSRREGNNSGLAQACALLVLFACVVLESYPGPSVPWVPAMAVVAPFLLLKLALEWRRRMRPSEHLENSQVAWGALATVPAGMLAVGVIIEWFPFDPHGTAIWLYLALSLPLSLSVYGSMLLMALAEPHLVRHQETKYEGEERERLS